MREELVFCDGSGRVEVETEKGEVDAFSEKEELVLFVFVVKEEERDGGCVDSDEPRTTVLFLSLTREGTSFFFCCVVVVEERKENDAGVVEGREGKTDVVVVVAFPGVVEMEGFE